MDTLVSVCSRLPKAASSVSLRSSVNVFTPRQVAGRLPGGTLQECRCLLSRKLLYRVYSCQVCNALTWQTPSLQGSRNATRGLQSLQARQIQVVRVALTHLGAGIVQRLDQFGIVVIPTDFVPPVLGQSIAEVPTSANPYDGRDVAMMAGIHPHLRRTSSGWSGCASMAGSLSREPLPPPRSPADPAPTRRGRFHSFQL